MLTRMNPDADDLQAIQPIPISLVLSVLCLKMKLGCCSR